MMIEKDLRISSKAAGFVYIHIITQYKITLILEEISQDLRQSKIINKLFNKIVANKFVLIINVQLNSFQQILQSVLL